MAAILRGYGRAGTLTILICSTSALLIARDAININGENMNIEKIVSKMDFGKKVKAADEELEIILKYTKKVWLIENLNRLSGEHVNLDVLSEEDRFYVILADKYVEEHGGWLKEFNKQHEIRNKIALKQIEVDYSGKFVTNEDRTRKSINNEIEIKNELDSDHNSMKGSVARAFIVIVVGALTLIFIKQWMTVGLNKIDRGLVVVPIMWIAFISLVILAKEEYLSKNGFGFIAKSVKYIFVAGILLLVISYISQCSGFGGGNFNGIPDNVRM